MTGGRQASSNVANHGVSQFVLRRESVSKLAGPGWAGHPKKLHSPLPLGSSYKRRSNLL